MSSEKLQEAIALIKAGDKKGGQDLLVDLVNTDPRNETAWLWLASVVSPDKRVFCLEKVLSINPSNLHAKQYLEKLKPSEQIQSDPITQPRATNTGSTTISSSQYWTIPFGKNLVDIIILEATKLITFHVIPMKVPAILEQLSRGSITKEWYEKNVMSGSKYKSINLNQISRVRLLLNDVTIYYSDSVTKEMSTKITCREDKDSDAIIEALHTRLGNQFVSTSKQNSRLEVARRSLITLLITFGIAGFGYWMAQEAVGVEITGRRGSGIVAILQLIGPNGMLCIGGGLIILMLISIVSSFARPPMETLLVKKGSSNS